MFPASRPRRPFALLVALAVMVVSFCVVPATTANAYSTTSTKGTLLTYINEQRQDASAAAWTQVPLLDNWTQDYADSYAACKGCSDPSNLPSYTAAPVAHTLVLKATSGSSSGRISKLESQMQVETATDDSDPWGAIGYATHGDTGYLFIVGFDISDSQTPFSSFASGEAKVHGTDRVGSTLTVTVPLLAPAPTGYQYQWTVKHGSTVTDVGTGSTYMPSASDLGAKISVTVSGELSDYAPASFRAKSGTIGHGKFVGAKLEMGGERVTNQSIEFSVNVTPSPDSYTWTWYRNGKKFANVGNEYSFQSTDLGKRIDVKVVIASPGFDSVTLETHTTKKVLAP
jgi:hypothetical protein